VEDFMKRAQSQKPTSHPSHSLNQRLNLYALAAGAAGVGILAVPHSLEAEVVYTATNITLTNGSLAIDLNHDGAVDFILSNKSTGFCCLYTRVLNVRGGFVGSSQNAVMGAGKNARALKEGATIGPQQSFLAAPLAMATAINDSNSFFYVFGEFANKSDRFLGVEFVLPQGVRHYGWIRFQPVRAGFRLGKPIVSATVTGYAYETVANQPISAGQTKEQTAELAPPSDLSPMSQPAGLGLLALGAPGLHVWRRQDSEQLVHGELS
jgi:hypothetical protein